MIEQYEKSHSYRNNPIFSGPKHELYKWETRNEPGQLLWIDKKKLVIDVPSYQRKTTNKSKVTKIASQFDWILFEALVVSLRDDNRYYVIEGGHRLRAAWSREDIEKVPCIVFQDKTVKEEAQAFVDSALSVSAINSLDKYKAQLCAENPTALQVSELLERHGLHATRDSGEKHGITAIQAVIFLVNTSPAIADDVMSLCVDVCKDDMQPSGFMIRAFQYLLHNKTSLGFDISKGSLRERLINIGPQLIVKGIRTEAGLSGKGGEKVHARGILNVLNKGLRNKLRISI